MPDGTVRPSPGNAAELTSTPAARNPCSNAGYMSHVPESPITITCRGGSTTTGSAAGTTAGVGGAMVGGGAGTTTDELSTGSDPEAVATDSERTDSAATVASAT